VSEDGFEDGSSFGVELGIDARSEDGIEDGSTLVVELGIDESFDNGFEDGCRDGTAAASWLGIELDIDEGSKDGFVEAHSISRDHLIRKPDPPTVRLQSPKAWVLPA
jgi:hypothetical protein